MYYTKKQNAAELSPNFNIPWVPEICRKAARREERERWENLWLPATADWSYRANRFELGSRSDPTSWLEEPYSVTWLAFVNWQVCCYWLLVNRLSWPYRSTKVRFGSPATRGFLSPLLSLSSLVSSRPKKTSETTVPNLRSQRKHLLQEPPSWPISTHPQYGLRIWGNKMQLNS